MLKFIKDRLFSLIVVLFASFYISYFVTVGYQIICVHRLLITEHNVKQINFGLITFVIFAFVPILLWKMVADSEIPILKETIGIRFILSEIAIVFTICLFISKSIFNSIAGTIMAFESDRILDLKGRVVLIEVLSVVIPFILFLYLSNKVILHFLRKFKE